METIQQQLNALQTSVQRQRLLNIALLGIIVAGGFIAAVRPVGDATFDTITCKGWKVVDSQGKDRIIASTLSNGTSGVEWHDQSGLFRIGVATLPDGVATIQCNDNAGKPRITTATSADGIAALTWRDKNGSARICTATDTDGNVLLPTKDMNPPKP